jgi:hypothetical protein
MFGGRGVHQLYGRRQVTRSRYSRFFEVPQLTEPYPFGPPLGAYGEAEFVFASIKVLTITGECFALRISHAYPRSVHPGLIILGIILDLGGGPDHDRIGFRYWKHPGPFVQFDGISGAKGRFLGFSKVFTQAAFSYIGTEIVAVSPSSQCAGLVDQRVDTHSSTCVVLAKFF